MPAITKMFNIAKHGHPHPNCLLCGHENPWSLQLSFTPGEGGKVFARFQGRNELQGYDGILHGGVIAALLDSAMTNCLFQHKVRAVTGDLRIRYRHPVPATAELEIRAVIEFIKPPLYVMKAEIRQNNKSMATASAKFIRITE
jgi:acyl-coenzyme A thioesterase PaaI-like protein